MQNTAKQNYSGSVASYDTRRGNKKGLFYNEPTWGGSSDNIKIFDNCQFYLLKTGSLAYVINTIRHFNMW